MTTTQRSADASTPQVCNISCHCNVELLRRIGLVLPIIMSTISDTQHGYCDTQLQ